MFSSVPGKLVEIPQTKLFKLRDLYYKVWPENHIGFYTINNYIKWFDLDHSCNGTDENQESVKIYSLNGDWSDGLFLVVDRHQIIFNTLSVNLDRLITALCLLDNPNGYILNGFPNRLMPAVLIFMEVKGFQMYHPLNVTTLWYFLSKDDARYIEISVPNNITLKPLSIEHANIANNSWSWKHYGSKELLERLIKYNISVGAFTIDDELIGWCLRQQIGGLGVLEVKENHRRQGIGSLLVKAITKSLYDNNEDICASVKENNFESRRTFEKLGFKIMDKTHWIFLEPFVHI